MPRVLVEQSVSDEIRLGNKVTILVTFRLNHDVTICKGDSGFAW